MPNEGQEAVTPADVLAQVLDMANELFGRRVDATDNFFDIGGDSVCAIGLAGRIDEAFGVEPDVNDLFAAATFAEFVEKIVPELNVSSRRQVDIKNATRHGAP